MTPARRRYGLSTLIANGWKMRAIALLSTLQSADIVLPTTDGREIRLRQITEPTAEQKSLLQRGISLPEHLQRHRECSADSAVA
jgi:hypothetical protein